MIIKFLGYKTFLAGVERGLIDIQRARWSMVFILGRSRRERFSFSASVLQVSERTRLVLGVGARALCERDMMVKHDVE